MLEQILCKMKEGLPINALQREVEEKLYDLYDLNTDERDLIQLASHSTVY